ncbi:MAG: hypothetical protein ACR2JV_00015 [Gaiellales bacterium]
MPTIIDDDGKERLTRTCYVIELETEACADRRAPCGGGCGKVPLYVGETALVAEERFAQHKSGRKASRWVKRYGVRLRQELARGYEDLGSDSRVADRKEKELAEQLRRTGKYCVRTGP